MPRPAKSNPNMKWRAVDRPIITTSSLPPDLLKAIENTARSNRAVELEFVGDPIGCRRVLQRLVGLNQRGAFCGPMKTARRGDKLYVWIDTRQRGRPPVATEALPPTVTSPMLPTVTDATPPTVTDAEPPPEDVNP